MHPFDRPTRQSYYAILFILGKTFRLLVRQLWVVILVIFFNPKQKVFGSFTIVILVMTAFGAISSIIAYFNYYFYIKDGELVLEKGVLQKTKVTVPLDRIQTVNFKQDLLHRFLNVVAVDIDTAGSAGKEFSLQAIDLKQAEALREYVDNFRRELESSTVQQFDSSVVSEESPETVETLQTKEAPAAAQTLLFRLSPMDLLKIGVSQNHLRTVGILMAFFLGFADDVKEALGFDWIEELEQKIGTARQDDWLFFFVMVLPFFLVVSFLVSLVQTVLKYYGLVFWRTERGFKMVGGLFTRQEISANLLKIQYLRWNTNPLKRLFNMFSVRLPQAASVQVEGKMAMNIPGCYGPHLEAVRAAHFPEEKDLEFEEHGVSQRIIVRQIMLQGVVPVVFFMLLTQWTGLPFWVWLLWLPVAVWMAVRYHRSWRWFVSEEGLRTSWGVVNQHSVLLQWYKVQAVSIHQSWFLERRGLATLLLYTAAGAVSVPYIPIEKARAVQDFVLYKAEVDERKWM